MHRQCNFCFSYLCEKEELIGLQLCQGCYAKLEFVHLYKGQKCINCQKKIRNVEERSAICEDCKYWQKHYDVALIPNRALLYYNEFAHQIMERLKFQGDIQLWQSICPLIKMFHLLPRNLIQRIPSSEQTYQKRDFDHLAYILDYTQTRSVDLLKKKPNIVSQIKLQDVNARRKLKSGFEIQSINIEENITLFDDVYTTGSTLKDSQIKLRNAHFIVLNSRTIFRSDLR